MPTPINTEAKLTVVIPVYNRPKLIQRTLECLVAQTYRPFNVIIVDNNSTDNTLEVVKTFAQQHSTDELNIRVLSETTPGATAARNKGLSEVKTKWTMFFDSDDIMRPTHIERALSTAHNNPKAELIGWDVEHINIKGTRRIKPFEPNDIEYNNLFHASLATQRYMARTMLFYLLGGWNTNVPIWNDIEFGARLLAFHPNIVKAEGSEPTVTVEAQANSITGDSYGSRIDQYHYALDSIKRTLPARYKCWVELKKVIIGATIVREGNKEGKKLFRDAMSNTTDYWHRFMWRIAYTYTRLGGRGIARILKQSIC
jgi:glycosyltransferase involved in cell wall biosynthesis